jgi:hypothetical protein
MRDWEGDIEYLDMRGTLEEALQAGLIKLLELWGTLTILRI